MQNVKPSDLPLAAHQVSPVSGAIKRVAEILPAPLLPGEQEAARRNNALREIERHRAALGAAVRQAIDEVQDAEFHGSRRSFPRPAYRSP